MNSAHTDVIFTYKPAVAAAKLDRRSANLSRAIKRACSMSAIAFCTSAAKRKTLRRKLLSAPMTASTALISSVSLVLWIWRVAANLCLNHLELQKVTTELDDERDADPSQRPESVVEVRERGEQIRKALASLPAKLWSSNCDIIRKCRTMKLPNS